MTSAAPKTPDTAAGVQRPRRVRLSKPVLRAWAWVIGILTFLGPLTAFGLQPKPVEATPSATTGQQQPKAQAIHRLHRVIVYEPQVPLPPSAPQITYTGGGGGGTAGSSDSGGGGGGGRYNPPVVTSRGS